MMTEDILWPRRAAAGFADNDNGVDVWAASLNFDPVVLGRLAATLSSAERERAARFHFTRDRDRYVAGRGFVRCILGRYLKARPAELEIEHGPQGKPALAGRWAKSGLHFNLSHCEDLALVAVTRAGRVGVDVERIRPLSDADELANLFFSRPERAALEALPADDKPAAFFSLWTCKEAWLKATGDGIGESLSQVELALTPTGAARLLKTPEAYPRSATDWALHQLTPAPAFGAALAVSSRAEGVHCWRWNETDNSYWS
jgi:4'-phosphopantetheinyl transferase